jgi:hypothetical protein
MRGDASALAEHLKERVYISFTALAVVLALRAGEHEISAGSAAATLFVTVLGALLAIFVADFVSHLAAHGVLPDRSQLRHMLGVSLGALSAIVLPLVLVGLAAVGVWSLDAGLFAAVIVLLATLAAVGFLAVRRARIPTWQKLVVLLAEAGLGLAVIALEVLAHG